VFTSTWAVEGSREKARAKLHVQYCIAVELTSPVNKAEFPNFAIGNL
jgi:hypothetical protein